MPFSKAFEGHRLAERVQRLRKTPILGYALAIALLAVATAVRWAMGEFAITPFITYYPVIIIAALLGGLGPGLLAASGSALLAWFLFIPHHFSFAFTTPQEVSLLLFAFASLLIVGLVSMFNLATDRLIEQERNVRLESAPNGIVVVDESGTNKLVNTSTERLFGYAPNELIGRRVEDLVPQRLSDAHQTMRALYLRQPETRPMGAGRDLSGMRKDGSEFTVEIGLNPVSSSGKTAVLATIIDISERKRAQEQQQLLIRELHHRSQNLFAVIQSIADRSLAEGQSITETKKVLSGRLRALAQAHALLAEAAWEGVALSELLKRELASFSDRYEIAGCDVVVNTPAAQKFALIVHELATNAVKYGALSVPQGRVRIEGSVNGSNLAGTFSFTWKESGGPAVAEPVRKGFGSVILLEAAKQVGEQVALHFEPEGVRYELLAQMEAITGQAPHPPRAESPDAQAS